MCQVHPTNDLIFIYYNKKLQTSKMLKMGKRKKAGKSTYHRVDIQHLMQSLILKLLVIIVSKCSEVKSTFHLCRSIHKSRLYNCYLNFSVQIKRLKTQQKVKGAGVYDPFITAEIVLIDSFTECDIIWEFID